MARSRRANPFKGALFWVFFLVVCVAAIKLMVRMKRRTPFTSADLEDSTTGATQQCMAADPCGPMLPCEVQLPPPSRPPHPTPRPLTASLRHLPGTPAGDFSRYRVLQGTADTAGESITIALTMHPKARGVYKGVFSPPSARCWRAAASSRVPCAAASVRQTPCSARHGSPPQASCRCARACARCRAVGFSEGAPAPAAAGDGHGAARQAGLLAGPRGRRGTADAGAGGGVSARCGGQGRAAAGRKARGGKGEAGGGGGLCSRGWPRHGTGPQGVASLPGRAGGPHLLQTAAGGVPPRHPMFFCAPLQGNRIACGTTTLTGPSRCTSPSSPPGRVEKRCTKP